MAKSRKGESPDARELVEGVGREIDRWLKDRRMSGRELARKSDLSSSVLSDWINARVQMSLGSLADLSNAMEMHPERLIALAMGRGGSSDDLKALVRELPIAEQVAFLHWLIDQVCGVRPKTLEEFRAALKSNPVESANRSELPIERIHKIAEGADIANFETMALARIWGADQEWLISLVKASKVRSNPVTISGQPSKSRQKKPLNAEAEDR